MGFGVNLYLFPHSGMESWKENEQTRRLVFFVSKRFSFWNRDIYAIILIPLDIFRSTTFVNIIADVFYIVFRPIIIWNFILFFQFFLFYLQVCLLQPVQPFQFYLLLTFKVGIILHRWTLSENVRTWAKLSLPFASLCDDSITYLLWQYMFSCYAIFL